MMMMMMMAITILRRQVDFQAKLQRKRVTVTVTGGEKRLGAMRQTRMGGLKRPLFGLKTTMLVNFRAVIEGEGSKSWAVSVWCSMYKIVEGKMERFVEMGGLYA